MSVVAVIRVVEVEKHGVKLSITPPGNRGERPWWLRIGAGVEISVTGNHVSVTHSKEVAKR